MIILFMGCGGPDEPARVLVFSKTTVFRHESIPAGIEAIKKLGEKNNFIVDTTENAKNFNEENLRKYKAVIFLSTTGDVLNKQEQNDFERFIQAGGGFIGIHAAADTEYNWEWYGKLVGGYFNGHPNGPNVRTATFNIIDKTHPATDSLPDTWEREDEFYNYKNLQEDLNVLITIDESTYEGGTNGEFHPMAWYHEFDGGRAFYTAMGHTNETFTDPLFLSHLMGGLEYVLGGDSPAKLDYQMASTERVPDENRFTKVVLAEKLNEPMELAVMSDRRVMFIERLGAVRLYDPSTGKITDVGKIDVSHKYNNQDGNQPEAEDGLLGLALDPNFDQNHWVYMYYSPVGDEPKNVLSRFEFKNDQIDMASEKVMLEVAVQRDECCHTGGSIAFDAKGDLYLSTGDNTSPRDTKYAPIDDRPGRIPWDARKGTSNTNDLRGKILRITPQEDGTYTIPEGNLFPEGTDKTRPEIYVMGTRNPFRISVDKKTGYVYWGDVGPDAATDSAGLGPQAYDEVNQAREPGYFGWPLFTGDDYAYNDYDFATGESGPKFDPEHPINDSRNNTGLVELPATAPNFIWYPYGESEEFPLLGSGGRTAMAGPVYNVDEFADSDTDRRFPEYYDGKLFIYEWMRGWIIAVTMDEEGNYTDMERFMPSHEFSNPMDMEFGPEGDMYVLEYGTGWFVANDNARLVRIEYNGGNRKPQVHVAANKTRGAVPLTVEFDSKGTKDFDRDPITYEWKVLTSTGSQVATSEEANPSFTLDEPGVYNARLTVRDDKGERTISETELIAGNEPAKIAFNMPGSNSSFFFEGVPFEYEVAVEDKEDGTLGNGIAENEVAVTIDYLPEGYDQIEIAQGHVMANESVAAVAGMKLMEESDCKACHKIDSKSAGPAYMEVAKKYKGDPNAVEYLANKVINGGSGVWGDIAMAAHPQLSNDDASNIVRYILSLGDEKKEIKTLPVKGKYTVQIPEGQRKDGMLVIRASYSDKAVNDVPAVNVQDMFTLRSPTVIPANAAEMDGVQVFEFGGRKLAIVSNSGAYTMLSDIDLTGIGAVVCTVTVPVNQLNAAGGVIEVHLDSPDGELIGSSEMLSPVEGEVQRVPPANAMIPLSPTSGKHNLYFVYKNDKAANGQGLMIHLASTFVPAGSNQVSMK